VTIEDDLDRRIIEHFAEHGNVIAKALLEFGAFADPDWLGGQPFPPKTREDSGGSYTGPFPVTFPKRGEA
jgi:hypothetical protein